ncbi:MAG: hypothetical protein IJO90_06430 [Alistipes sp.]|nr:hypothetical protein [Alistipes sp.]MBQ9962988.1 hypothetical protein [Alistipes sp.]
MKQLSVILISIMTLLVSQIAGDYLLSSDNISHPCQRTIAELDYNHDSNPISIISSSQSRVPSAARRVLLHNSKVCIAHVHHHTIRGIITAFVADVERCTSLLKVSTVFKWHRIRI